MRDPATALEDQHAVGLRQGALRIVADQHPGAPAADQLTRERLALGIEVGVGLVEQQQPWVVKDAAGDRESLAHSGGEVLDPLVGAPLHPDRFEQHVDAVLRRPGARSCEVGR